MNSLVIGKSSCSKTKCERSNTTAYVAMANQISGFPCFTSALSALEAASRS